MKTETMIHELAKQGQPVKRVGPPIARFCRWAAVASLCVAVGVAVFGFRADLESVSRSPIFLLQAALTLALGALSALSAFILSVPDKAKPWLNVVPLATLGLWAVVLLAMLVLGDGAKAGFGVTCVRDILVLGLPPGALLYFMLRRAAPLKVGMVGVLAALGVAALGALGTQFICRNDDPLHILVWHYVPVLILGVIGIWLGRLLFRWERR